MHELMILAMTAIISSMAAIGIMLALAWCFITRKVDNYLREWHRPDYDDFTKGMYE